MTCFNRKHRRSQCLILQYKTHLWYARGWFAPASFPQFCSSPKSAADPTPLSQVGTKLAPEMGPACSRATQRFGLLKQNLGLPLTNMYLQFFIIIIAIRHDVGIIILYFYEGQDSKNLFEPHRTELPINLKPKPNVS